MITVPPKNLTLGLFLLLGTTIGFLALAFHLNQAQRQNRELKRTLEFLNASFETEHQSFQQQRDSLQRIITAQEKQQENLKETISTLEKTKATIKKKHHEKQISILRIRTVDSLHDEVARHYRR